MFFLVAKGTNRVRSWNEFKCLAKKVKPSSLVYVLEQYGFSSEKELVDRARIYLEICGAQQKKEKIQLKTFNDYYEYSIFKINQGDYEEALNLLEKAQEIKPKEGKISYLIANTYCLMGQAESCLENLMKAIQLDKFFGILAQNEADFEPLWEDKKFKLITRMA